MVQLLFREPLIIAGASARAAAASAVRGGMRAVGFDLFGDEDLRALAETHVVANLQRKLVAAMKGHPAGRWMYTGALENHPRIVAAISQRHRLLGNSPEVLREVRDPFRVHDILKSAGFKLLEVRASDSPPPRDGNWLIKPIRSAAGRGIAVWDDVGKSGSPGEPHYFQQRFIGTPIAAVFLASHLSCRLLGITRQLVGEAELHAKPFAYCGSIGPLPLTPALRGEVERIGKLIAETCHLRGVFGIDLLIDRARVKLTEINPRYPASAEVLEYALGLPMVPLHVAACESFAADSQSEVAERERRIAELLKDGRAARSDNDTIVGKAILFAERDVVAPRLPKTPVDSGVTPQIADVPQPGTGIPCGAPICSVFATGSNMVQCLNELFDRVRSLDSSCNL